MNNLSENKDTLTVKTAWKKEDYQKRDFAAITDATGLILKSINFPVNRRRNFVCALQGVGNGREEFQASHLVLARRLGHKGEQKTAETSVYRELQALKSFQAASQILLFDIEQGGGSKCRRTGYRDYITPAAIALVNRAAALKAANAEMEKEPLGKVMESMVGEALALLPAYAGSQLAEQAARPKPKMRRISKAKIRQRETDREHLANTLSRCLADFDARSETERLREFARFVADYAVETAEDIIRARSVKKLNLADMVTTSDPPHFLKNDGAVLNGDGLHVSSPPAHFFETPSRNGDQPSSLSTAGDPAGGLLKAALSYARRGWKIIPLHTPDENGVCSCSCGEDCHAPGKHPRTAQGVKNSTADETSIKNWWNRFANANIGIACGAESGIICLDIDPRSGGNETLKRLVEQYGALPPTFEVETGGGGKHFLFKYPEGISVKNSSGKIGAGIDIKSGNGFIVAAASRHASGKFYRVLNDSEPAAIPEWLLQAICSKEELTRNYDGETVRQSQLARTGNLRGSSGYIIPDGVRNEKLFKIACAMVGRSENREKITAEIERVNCLNCSPPIEANEVEIIIKSALRYGIGTD